jgi:7,8-dihydroneopterin aldolase/epimerase/oxygenase
MFNVVAKALHCIDRFLNVNSQFSSMPNLLTISLNNVRFRAYHGLYPEERQKGNDFVVNMEVSYDPGPGTIFSLEDTIDYATLFDIINVQMQRPVDLLETLVQQITGTVHQEFQQVKEISVSIEKLNPPIDKFSGSATVRYKAVF